MTLRLLEVAALPFPSPQGTQALLREQCEALAARGHEVHLLVYAHGDRRLEAPLAEAVAGREREGRRGLVLVHRLADWPRERSLRSGPSLGKVLLDARLVARARRLDRTLAPDLVHAHNYEALAACLAARPRAPLVYHAHTLFGPELPTFARSRPGRGAARVAGGLGDRLLPPRAALTVAVSPRLAEGLAALGHPRERLRTVVPGVALPGPPAAGEEARARLGLEAAEVVGYVGNLDRYQGLDLLLDAVAEVAARRPALRLLVVTASEPGPLLAAARRRGLSDRVVLRDHGPSFAAALADLAAAQVTAVPRSTAGGIPMKALASLAAARPLVATESGSAGLDLGEAALVVPDGAPGAMARAFEALLETPSEARARGAAGRRLAETRFSWGRSCEALEAAFGAALARRRGV